MHNIITTPLTWDEILAILFVVFNPLKVVGPFAALTGGCGQAFCKRLAGRATILAGIGVVVAGVLGQRILIAWGVRQALLLLAGGIIWFLMALLTVLQPYLPVIQRYPSAEEPSLALALKPLAFSTIITPYGTATLIVLMATMPTLAMQVVVLALTAVMLLLNWIAMIFAHTIQRLFAIPLELIGWVLGVLQVALGLNLIYIALLHLSVVSTRP